MVVFDVLLATAFFQEQVFASIDAACALVDRGSVLARELDERVTKAGGQFL
jgi:hypothetical protein